jgi:hypothetical protein
MEKSQHYAPIECGVVIVFLPGDPALSQLASDDWDVSHLICWHWHITLVSHTPQLTDRIVSPMRCSARRPPHEGCAGGRTFLAEGAQPRLDDSAWPIIGALAERPQANIRCCAVADCVLARECAAPRIAPQSAIRALLTSPHQTSSPPRSPPCKLCCPTFPSPSLITRSTPCTSSDGVKSIVSTFRESRSRCRQGAVPTESPLCARG